MIYFSKDKTHLRTAPLNTNPLIRYSTELIIVDLIGAADGGDGGRGYGVYGLFHLRTNKELNFESISMT